MSTVQTRPAFDQKERARVQRALRRYMEEHRIGTPTLQLRIMEADTPHRRELPLSTLQRFITGSHRTSDAYVDMCRRFLESLGEGAAPELGAALAGFLGGQTAGQEVIETESYAGPYVIHSIPEALPGMPARAFANFEAVPGERFLAFTETAHEKAQAEGASRRHLSEGALVLNAGAAYGLLRSCLTRQPKSYFLRHVSAAGSDKTMFEGSATYADLENVIHHHAVRVDMRAELVGEGATEEAPE